MTTLLTIQTAPRDEELLKKEGVYVQRRLAEELANKGYKIWSNDAEKSAFVTASPDQRVRALCHFLKEYDAGTAPEAQNVRTPAAAPAPAQPVETPAPEAAVSKGRQPRTQAAAPASPAAAAPSPSSGVQELLLVIKAQAESLETLTKQVGDLVKSSASLAAAINDLKASNVTSQQIQTVQLGLLGILGQQALSTSLNDLVAMAVNDGNGVLDLLENQGKG